MSNKNVNVNVISINMADMIGAILGVAKEEVKSAIPRLNLDKEIETVIFNDPATIVLWKDGTKTVSKCQNNDVFNKEHGLAMCIVRKVVGNRRYNDFFEKWCK